MQNRCDDSFPSNHAPYLGLLCVKDCADMKREKLVNMTISEEGGYVSVIKIMRGERV